MRGFYKLVALLLALAVLAGCATTYQKRGFTGGYSETRIDNSDYIVNFDGNGKTDKDRVWYFWIYRCAQLTQEKGYTYFSLMPVQSSMNKTSFNPDEDGHAYPAVLIGDANGRVIDVHSSGGGGGAHLMYIPGAGTIVSWHSKAIVAMYGNDVPQKRFVIRAQSILETLGEYIRTNGLSTPPDRTTITNNATFAVAPDNTIVNVHQYLLTHIRPATAPTPYAHAASPYTIQPTRNGMAVPAPSSSADIANAATPTAASAPATSTVNALSAKAPAINAGPSMAQSVASQMGCGVVQANGNSTYVAPCGPYNVLISCDSDQCRPTHTIKAKSDD